MQRRRVREVQCLAQACAVNDGELVNFVPGYWAVQHSPPVLEGRGSGQSHQELAAGMSRFRLYTSLDRRIYSPIASIRHHIFECTCFVSILCLLDGPIVS